MNVMNVEISHVTNVDFKSREEEVRCEVGREYNSRVAASSCASSLLPGQKKRQGAGGERILNAKQGGQ